VRIDRLRHDDCLELHFPQFFLRLVAAEARSIFSPCQPDRALVVIGVGSFPWKGQQVSIFPLHVVVIPLRILAAAMLRVGEHGGLVSQRLFRRAGVKRQLNHLPIRLMAVVEIVERVIEPVLLRQLSGTIRFRRDMRVDCWRKTEFCRSLA